MIQLRALRFALCSIVLTSFAGCTLQSSDTGAGAVPATPEEPEAVAPAEPVAANIAALTSTGRYALEMDNGGSAGWIQSSEDGGAVADVFVEASGKKQIGAVRDKNLVVRADFNVSPTFYNWVNDSWVDPQISRSGKLGRSISNGNSNSVPESLHFQGARIVSTNFPALGGGNGTGATASISVDLAADSIEHVGAMALPTGFGAPNFHPGNFSLSMDGIDPGGIVKIDAFSIASSVGPNQVVFPDLTVTVSNQSAVKWREWFRDFAFLGQNSDDKERSGTITLTGDNGRKLIIHLGHVGIRRLVEVPATATASAAVKVVLYVETMTLEAR